MSFEYYEPFAHKDALQIVSVPVPAIPFTFPNIGERHSLVNI